MFLSFIVNARRFKLFSQEQDSIITECIQTLNRCATLLSECATSLSKLCSTGDIAQQDSIVVSHIIDEYGVSVSSESYKLKGTFECSNGLISVTTSSYTSRITVVVHSGFKTKLDTPNGMSKSAVALRSILLNSDIPSHIKGDERIFDTNFCITGWSAGVTYGALKGYNVCTTSKAYKEFMQFIKK